MRLDTLQVRQVSDAALDWYADIVTKVEARDLSFAPVMRDDCIMQVNDRLPLYGKTAIMSSMDRYYETFGALDHDLLNIYGDDRNFVVELLFHFTPRSGDGRVTMPGSAIYDRDDQGRLASVRVYIGAGSMLEAFTGTGR
jgi:hypothetical protein